MTPSGDKPWRSLADEEPPERGLAELMAAARVKAEAMTRPSWWKRAFDVLRRPPVLALATVVVLLGGVLVVGRHPDEVQAPAPETVPAAVPTVEQPAVPPGAPADEPALPPQVVVPSEPAPHAEPKPATSTSRPRAIEKTAPTKTGNGAPANTAPVKPAPAKIAPAKIAPAKPAPGNGASDQKASARDEAQLAAPDSVNAAVDDDTAPVAQGVITAVVPKSAAKAPVPKGAANAPVPKASAPDPLARCRAAAARKDCAGAKACAREVEKSDPSYYRANATKDAALKSCL